MKAFIPSQFCKCVKLSTPLVNIHIANPNFNIPTFWNWNVGQFTNMDAFTNMVDYGCTFIWLSSISNV
jgi:hypothetical protein